MGRAKKNVEVEAQVIARGNVVPMMTETESEETVQYVSDEDAAREDRLVSEIRMITEQTKQVVLFNSIEIGRRLTEAKAMVKRGTWGTWLKERVDYSQRTANNFMKMRCMSETYRVRRFSRRYRRKSCMRTGEREVGIQTVG